MAERPGWRPGRSRIIWGVAGIAVVGVIIGVIIALYWVPGSGFDTYTPIKSGGVEVQREKTLWDWLDLLIVPAVLAVGGYWFTRSERQSDREIAERRTKEDREIAERQVQTDREIAADRIRDAALREYLDRMSELLLAHKLAASAEGEPVRYVARARTLIILQTLSGDASRKGEVVLFLIEARLIDKNDPIVVLSWADLSRADLSRVILSGAILIEATLNGANLIEAILSGAILSGAILSGVHLRGGAVLGEADLRGGAVLGEADLSRADLSGANLTNAQITNKQLAQARSLKGATMPDGSKHD